MHIVQDLITAYSEHIDLPIALVSTDGQIIYEANRFSALPKRDVTMCLALSSDLKYPMIVSATTQSDQVETFYLLSQPFTLQQCTYILIAGKYTLTESMQQNEHYQSKHSTDIPYMMDCLHNLLYVFMLKHEQEENLVISKDMKNVFYLFDDISMQNLTTEQLLTKIVEKLYTLSNVDFIGFAQKKVNNTYEIRFVLGKGMDIMCGEQFYYGEGLLGQAFLKKSRFFWEKRQESVYPEFFTRHKLYPEQLYGIPLIDENEIDTIIFGGMFTEGKLHTTDVEILNNMILLMTQKNKVDVEIASLKKDRMIFKEWLNFVELVNENPHDKKMAMHLLNFCSVLNGGLACCVTMCNQTVVTLNTIDEQMRAQHQMFKAIKMKKPYFIEQTPHYLHFYLQDVGTYTIYFAESEFLYDEVAMITSVLKLFQLAGAAKHTEVEKSAVDYYYKAMKELNKASYDNATTAIELVTNLYNKELFDEQTYEYLCDVCKILPYSHSFLQQYVQHLPPISESVELATFEQKVIAFLDREIIGNNRFATLKHTPKEEEALQLALEEVNNVNLLHKTTKSAFQLKFQELIAITDVFQITHRENEVLMLLVEGYSNQEIAEKLHISAHTVKNHITNIYKKLDVTDRYQAMKKILKF